MAKNTSRNHRRGSVNNRTQMRDRKNPNVWIKRDTSNGQFIARKEGTFKGVAKEQDGRRS